MPDQPSAPPNCVACQDSGHVCENHPTMLWGGLCCNDAAVYGVNCPHGACGCGGAGRPCPACCSPIPPDATRSILEAFTPDRLRTVGNA
jgi:hypothetical protein